MDAQHWTGDDPRELGPDPDSPDRHQPEWDCECHCDRCHQPLERDPVMGRCYARCGDCYGGDEPDGEAFRGGEAAALARAQMAHLQRTVK